MRFYKKSIVTLSLALAVLFGMTQVYIYLQRFFSIAVLYPILMYPLYTILLMIWRKSIIHRVIHPKTQRLMTNEVYVMMLWVTIRLFQQMLLYRNDFLMRFSGYFICIPLVTLPLIGFYTALHIGKNREYKMPRVLYILIIPAALLIIFMITNDLHGLVFSLERDNPLEFKANYGIFLILGWTLFFEFFRITVIIKKGSEVTQRKLKAIVPILTILMMFIVGIPYFISGFIVSWEPIELTVSMFFFEVLVWESSISLGLFPVNTYYREAFESSTVAMQITDKNGAYITVSKSTKPVTKKIFRKLLNSKTHSLTDIRPGTKICIHPIGSDYVIWQNDISKIRNAIQRLNRSNAKLKHENELLQKEIAISAESGRFSIKSKLYGQLSSEVSNQIKLMNTLIKECRTAGDKAACLGRICLIGTYIKRRSNMRLNSVESKITSREEMMTAFRDISNCLERLGTTSCYEYQNLKDINTEYAVFILDTLEQIFERFSFNIGRIYFKAAENEPAVIEITDDPKRFENLDIIRSDDRFCICTTVTDNKMIITINENHV